jgi:hypothetical protein
MFVRKPHRGAAFLPAAWPPIARLARFHDIFGLSALLMVAIFGFPPTKKLQ